MSVSPAECVSDNDGMTLLRACGKCPIGEEDLGLAPSQYKQAAGAKCLVDHAEEHPPPHHPPKVSSSPVNGALSGRSCASACEKNVKVLSQVHGEQDPSWGMVGGGGGGRPCTLPPHLLTSRPAVYHLLLLAHSHRGKNKCPFSGGGIFG